LNFSRGCESPMLCFRVRLRPCYGLPGLKVDRRKMESSSRLAPYKNRTTDPALWAFWAFSAYVKSITYVPSMAGSSTIPTRSTKSPSINKKISTRPRRSVAASSGQPTSASLSTDRRESNYPATRCKNSACNCRPSEN
jgi:hypothetical protein